MTFAFILGLLAVTIALTGYATIRMCEEKERIDRDIESLVLSKQLTDDLNNAANDLGWRR